MNAERTESIPPKTVLRTVHPVRIAARRSDGRVVYCAENPYPDPRHARYAARDARYRARSQLARHRLATRTVLMVAAIALGIIAIAGVLGVAGATHSEIGGAGAHSTPKSSWERGEMPYLYQTDTAWSERSYAGATIGESGCGPTCLSMVYVYLTGKTGKDPASLCAFSELGGYVDGGLTAWTLMTDGAAQLGLTSEEVPADASRIAAELEAGHPIIASMRPGDFTTTGHFIVLAGIDDAGNLTVRDPNSPDRSAQTWSIDTVLAQCANLWAFSV